MSSAWFHVPRRSRGSSLRAAHWLFPRASLKQGPLYNGVSHQAIVSPHSHPPLRSINVATAAIPPHNELRREQPQEADWLDNDLPPKPSDALRLQSQLNISDFFPRTSHRTKRRRNETAPKSNPPLPRRDGFPVEELETQLPRTRLDDMHSKAHRHSKIQTDHKDYAPTPTEYLVDTLQRTNDVNWAAGIKDPNQLFPHLLCQNHRRKFRRNQRVSLQGITSDYIHYVQPRLDRKSILAGISLDESLQRVWSDENMEYLGARGYDVSDVVAWAWVLRSKTLNQAAFRLLLLATTPKTANDPSPRRPPPFIPLLLLRQQLDTKTFRFLLVYSLHLITGQPLPAVDFFRESSSDDAILERFEMSDSAIPAIEPNMCASFVVRLLHNARELWPPAQLPIARAFAFYLASLQPERSPRISTSHNIAQLMAEKFNLALRLLSLPSKPSPFASISIQQQAQFELLKAMAKHTPPLPVTRRAYQGIISVQLAHKKTLAERQSASLKAPSWPPWKEERLGIDSERGIEGMTSRAMRVMSQMKEAGYSHSLWEEVSAIYAGWDTDKSPTIQTRTLMRQPEDIRGKFGDPENPSIWEARIRATRTVREAWACFLSYQDKGLPPRGNIYAAMAEKLIFWRKVAERGSNHVSNTLPGDGLEVFPEPSSARDLIYVRKDPPTLEELLEQMVSQGVRPRGRFLALLLRSAPTFSWGLHYIHCSDLQHEQIESLCTVWGQISDYKVQSKSNLEQLPNYLFSAFIDFLCRFSNFDQHYFAQHNSRAADIFPILMMDPPTTELPTTTLFSYSDGHPRTLFHAIQLLKVRSSRSPQTWTYVLSALTQGRVLDPSRGIHWTTQLVLAWYESLEVLGLMEQRNIDPSFSDLHILCASFSQIVIAGVQDADAVEDGLEVASQAVQRQAAQVAHLDSIPLRFEEFVPSGLKVLKDRFDQLVLLDPSNISLFEQASASLVNATDSKVTIPPIFHVPSPSILHAFVRALGLAEDADGLLSLLRWMSQHAPTLKETSDEYLNGDRMMRRTLIAMRMFLEGYWGRGSWESFRWTSSDDAPESREDRFIHDDLESDEEKETPYTDPTLKEAYEIVRATPGWGPWPSDEEVREYVVFSRHQKP